MCQIVQENDFSVQKRGLINVAGIEKQVPGVMLGVAGLTFWVAKFSFQKKKRERDRETQWLFEKSKDRHASGLPGVLALAVSLRWVALSPQLLPPDGVTCI